MTINYKKIGEKIKKYRKEKDWSQAFLAEKIDKSNEFLSHIENGNKGMSLETFVKITNALDVSADLLLIEDINLQENAIIRQILHKFSDCDKNELFVILKIVSVLTCAFGNYRQLEGFDTDK